MQAFIKDHNSFTTLAHSAVEDYEIKTSIYETVSTIVIESLETPPKEGDFLLIQEKQFFGIISNVEVDHNQTTLSCTQPLTLFNRESFFDSASFTYAEDYLASLITDNYKSPSDSAYALSYISVTVSTHTASTALPDVENNIYTVKSYASKIRRLYNIHCIFTFDKDHLYIEIKKLTSTTKNIDMSNPGYEILSQDFSSETVAKITTYCKETTQQQNWYLWDDDSITSDTATAGALWALQHQDLTFTNVIASSWTSWTPDTLRTGYGYKCEIPLRGVTENHIAEVTLDPNNTNSAYIHSIPTTGTNKVIIYSTTNGISLTIPQICCQLT